MANIRPFATNKLVEEHDIYVNFMEKRAEEIKKDGLDVEPPERLFYRSGKNKSIIKMDSNAAYNKLYRFVTKWHCIMISYDIWRKVCEGNVIGKSAISYKQSVHLSVPELHAFRTSVENAITHAECDYNTRCSHRATDTSKWDACRYLAMFWTYLDIVKDTKTQRYLPDSQTRANAAKVFGYDEDQNPFEMNGRYYHWKKEEQPVEEEKKYNLNLDTPIEDLDLSTRSYNCLWRAGHRTLGDVLKLKYEDLMKIRNLGLRHTKEILEKVEEIKKQSEESVIDIAEEAAKKVEEEEKLVVHDHSYVIPDEDAKVLAGLGKRLEKIDLEIDDIRANAAAKNACVMLDRRIDTLKDNTCKKFSEINGDIRNLDNEMTERFRELHELIQRELSKRRSSESPIIARRPSDDILSLCNQIVAIMQKSGMEEFCMKGDWVIDIHKKAEMGRATISYR
jgi:hypothetical protein